MWFIFPPPLLIKVKSSVLGDQLKSGKDQSSCFVGIRCYILLQGGTEALFYNKLSACFSALSAHRPYTYHWYQHIAAAVGRPFLSTGVAEVLSVCSHTVWKREKKTLSMNVFIYTLTNFTVGSVVGPIKLKSLS